MILRQPDSNTNDRPSGRKGNYTVSSDYDEVEKHDTNKT